MVRVALWAIRIYLLVLLSLIGLKFLRVSVGGQKNLPVPAHSVVLTNLPSATPASKPPP
ncbi:MAG: hypothetical protein WCO56_28305 [Verrucomicrobiota bacterium]